MEPITSLSAEPREVCRDGKDITGDGGVVKQLLKEGTGDIVPSDVKVDVHYTGWLLDSSRFDSSKDRPFSFSLGASASIITFF